MAISRLHADETHASLSNADDFFNDSCGYRISLTSSGSRHRDSDSGK